MSTPTRNEPFVLTAKLDCEGKKYQGVIFVSEYGNWTFGTRQPIGEDWDMTPGQWNLSTLLETFFSKDISEGDRLYIDCGQDWYVDGTREAIIEATFRIADFDY